MVSLSQVIKKAQERKVGIAHFNAADSVMVKTIIEAAQEVGGAPVIIGFSESEREFIGSEQALSLVQIAQEDGYPVFINADHVKTFESAKEAIDLGFDSITFDNSHLSEKENIKNTKEVVRYAKGKCLIEGEIGYIGAGSKVLQSLPEGASLTLDTITKEDEAEEFVNATGVDLFAPAVGNIHGMIAKGKNPHLFIERIQKLSEATQTPLVLHGASGIPDEDIVPAIESGVVIIHVSTELRQAYHQGLKNLSDELAPYRFFENAIDNMKVVILEKLRLFNKI